MTGVQTCALPILPILHLNGFKIANPTVLARIGREDLTALLRGYGHEPYFVIGDDPMTVHQQLARTLDDVLALSQPLAPQKAALPGLRISAVLSRVSL